ncbi:MAG TPA: PAS domain S-box protein [Solirubrobacteraceae bacterium]|jgi:diguanylate cyclase (GGDEF)-like protein/PAS domain S-box-containing protein|nr:PAS domain S-box protein [Solirubrobacteraceae bacterium]
MTRETTIRVLIVSAADAVVAELRAALGAIGSATFSIDVVQSASDAMVALRTLPSELTFVDVGDGNAGHMRELAQVSSTTADTALIALTSSGDELTSVATLELGAQECLVRGSDDLSPTRLMGSLRNALVRSAHDGSRPLATMIELSSDAILTINRERVVTRFNPAAEELFGWSASEVLGKPAEALVPNSDHHEQVAFVDRVLHGDSVEAFEVERTMRDGRTVIMSMSGSPIADAFGNVIEACLIIRDVTDQVNARLRLFEQQHLLESSQAAGRIGSWAVDRLTGRIDWSAEHYRLLRRDPSLPPATIDELLELVHPDDHELVRRSFFREAGFTIEARFLADPEEVRILRVRGEYIPREDEKPGRLLGITQDVTEERAEQAARHLAEEQMRRSFDEALIGMVIVDLDSNPLRVNGALCEIFGRTREELLATKFQELTHPDDRGDDEPVSQALLSGAQKHHVREKRYIHADGHTIWTEVAVSLITRPDGTPSHLVGQIQDITERRAHVEKLRHMADHDPLTGLLNRRGFDREMTAHVARAQRYGVTGALLMFDLDNFKQHNDAYGHGAGDDLLVALADCLRQRLRATDVIGRLGGDEFAVLLPDAGPPYASLVSESLLEHIRRITHGLPVVTGVTASIGLVCFERLRALSVETAMKCVDLALYEAKRRGRNCYAEWMPTGEIEPASPAE